MKHAVQRSFSLARNSHGMGVLAFVAALLLSSFYCGQAAANAYGKALASPERLDVRTLSLDLNSPAADSLFGVTPFSSPQTSSPYAQAVLSDSPAVYYRLDEAGGPVVHDSSGNGYEGAYQAGVTYGVQGAIADDPSDSAISATGLAITQSGANLPSGNSARTMEFWVRGGRQNPIAFTYGGEGGTNDQFRVTVYGGELWLTVDSSHGYASAQYALGLPQAWWDGNWHLFDVTYDGTKALGYMDGQLIGSFGVRTPLATVTSTSPLRIGDRTEVLGSDGPYSLDEFAIYPTALSPEQIDTHWSLGGTAATVCVTPPETPYVQAILKDSPLLYLRLDEPGNDPTHYVAHDSSGHCGASAPTNGAYENGVASVQGATLGDTDNAISASGLALTQSGTTLPSGNGSRTMEFWVRGGRQNPIAFTYGGAGGTNDQFRVTVYGGELWLTVDSSHSYASAQYSLGLPQAWWDGNWHLFDVTYNGTTALGYMDGQLVGSFGALTPLATVTGTSPLRIGDRAEVLGSDGPYSLDEFAIYPTALSPEQIDTHWTAETLTPPGMSVIAGTALIGGGGGAQGVRVQACPTDGASCTVDPYPVDEFGFFHFLVPDGTYTITIYPPAGSPDSPKTIGPLVLPPSALHLSAIFAPPGGLPEGVSLSSPGRGTQEHVVPGVNWGEPLRLSVTGCKEGFGVSYVRAPNPSTGKVETRAVWLNETPTNSGTYVGDIQPLAPLHGFGSLSDSVACPGHSHLVPDGGPPVGGTSVLISGTGFSSGAEVRFGSSPASSVTVLQDNLISATAPPGTAGTAVPVTVVTASGTTIPIGNYTYFDVTSLDTSAGPSAGGTTVTIRGHGFTGVKGVVFGLMPAASFTVVNPGEIQAQAPVGIGTVDVQVLNGFATSQATSSAFYTYQGGPPGTESVNEGVGDSAPYHLAAEIADISPPTECDTTPIPELCKLWDYAHDALTSPTGPGPLGVIVFGSATLAAAALCAVSLPVCAVGAAIGLFAYFVLHVRIDSSGIHIDPSGTVVDTHGNPIEGATVTLLEQPLTGPPFIPVEPSSGAIEPAENPETTKASGQFDWNALAGTYEVQAAAPGCHAPGEPGQASVFTSPFAIPPPAVGLMLTLECPGATAPVPKITSLSVSGGSTAGGNVVDISGEGLADLTGVSFGPNASVHVQPLSPYSVAAVAPAGSGTVDVTVSGPGGTSTTSESDRYTYSAPLVTASSPVVESVTPNSGPLSGGTAVTIKGTHLSGAFAVQFGETTATQVAAKSESEVQAVAPASAFAQRVDVTITTPTGTSAPTLADSFSYGSPPPAVTTNLTLTPSERTVEHEQTLTLKATVAPTDGGGSVAFYADGSSAPLSNCGAQALTHAGGAYQATCSTSSLAVGSHSLSANYTGDASYTTSSGGASVSVTQNVEEEAKEKTEREQRERKAREAAARKHAEEEATAKKRQEEEAAREHHAKPRRPTRGQLLAKALRACKKNKSKATRIACEKRAHRRYGSKPHAKGKPVKKR